MKTLKKILLTISILFAIFIGNLCHYVFFGQQKSMAKLDRGEELNLYECCSIYSMHTAIWMFGWVISPEAANEAKMMCVPHNKTVEIRNNFFLHSDVVKNSNGKPRWNVKSYDSNSKELRYALALSSTNTFIETDNNINLCHVRVEYTNAVHSVLNIPIHTELLCVLQDKEWLHPYNLVYYDLMP